MTSGGVRRVGWGIVVAALVCLSSGCELLGRDGGAGDGTGTGDADTVLGPVDAASTLCAEFCARQEECGLANPDCRAFCTRGERVALKRCVVDVEDCSGVRHCLETDAGETPDTDVGSDADTGGAPADTGDTGSEPSDTGDDGGPPDTSPPPDTTTDTGREAMDVSDTATGNDDGGDA